MEVEFRRSGVTSEFGAFVDSDIRKVPDDIARELMRRRIVKEVLRPVEVCKEEVEENG